MASAIAERAEENFPSKAYGPYLEAQGFAPFLARGLGSLTISVGSRKAHEAKRVAPVVEAIRFLARGDRQKRVILSRAKLVLAARKETSIVEELFRNKGGPENDFSVCTTWFISRHRRWYLIDVWRKRIDYPELKAAVRFLASQTPQNASSSRILAPGLRPSKNCSARSMVFSRSYLIATKSPACPSSPRSLSRV